MNENQFKAKSLELIHMTKEFLLLKKTYEECLGILIIIKKAKMVGDKEVPDKVRAFIGKVESLDEAEKMTNARMNELRTKIDELTHEIKKLSDQLQPYFSKIKQAEKTAVS